MMGNGRTWFPVRRDEESGECPRCHRSWLLEHEFREFAAGKSRPPFLYAACLGEPKP